MVNCGQNAIAHSRDIGAGGICLILEEPLETGKMVHLRFTLPGQQQEICGFGKVVWSKKALQQHYLVGIQFWAFEEDQKQAIETYLNG